MSRDLRDYARKTNVRLGIGAAILLFIIGIGLIYLVYGREAAALAFFCLAFALIPVVLIVLFFFLFDWIIKRAGRK
jgi:Ca2+/Na+ antiporter